MQIRLMGQCKMLCLCVEKSDNCSNGSVGRDKWGKGNSNFLEGVAFFIFRLFTFFLLFFVFTSFRHILFIFGNDHLLSLLQEKKNGYSLWD